MRYAHSEPMPRRRCSQELDVEVRSAGCLDLKRLADPSQRLRRADATWITLRPPGEDDAAHPGEGSVLIDFGEDLVSGPGPAGTQIGIGSLPGPDELRSVGQHEVLQLVRIDRDHRRHRPAVAGDDRRAPCAHHFINDLTRPAAQVADPTVSPAAVKLRGLGGNAASGGSQA